MKVSVCKNPHKISLRDVEDELRKFPVQRFQYGDFDNWVNAHIISMEADKIRNLGENNTDALYKYCVIIKCTFRYIQNDGTVSEKEEVGYSFHYVNDLDCAFINIDGYATEIQ